METAPYCHHCKTPIPDSAQGSAVRIGFRDSCHKCGSDLHACLNCQFHDDGAHHECRESSAEWVRDKTRNNVCEYFRLKTGASGDSGTAKANAMSALDDLFKK
jgi:hypothetical protein